MEGESSSNALKSRHQRKVCGHCNELLSYSAYRSHEALYYVEAKQRWLGARCDDSSTRRPLTDATESSNDDAMDYNTEDDPQASFLDQTGNNIVYGLNNAVSTYSIHSLQIGMQSKSLLLQDKIMISARMVWNLQLVMKVCISLHQACWLNNYHSVTFHRC